MKNPAISIIMPVYKAEKYVRRSLDSIMAQTFCDWEAVLIDDGSPDKSGDILDEYVNKDSRFHVIHKKNGGVSSARQLGLETSQGKYIIHVDPDDWVEPSMLEELYNKIVEDDADMVICDFIWDRPTLVRVSLQRPSAFDCKSIMTDLFTERLHGSVWNKLVRREVIIANQISFPSQLSIHEDLFFVTKLLLKDIKVSYLNKAFYHYVMGENSNSISQKVGQSYEYDVMILEMFDNLLYDNECRKYANRLFATKVIVKEFCRKESSSIIFMLKCTPYIKYIPYVKPLKRRVECFLSMMGFYGLIKSCEKWIKNR